MNPYRKRLFLLIAGLVVFSVIGLIGFNSRENLQKEMQITGSDQVKLHTPMAVATDGTKIFVANSGLNQITVFNREGKWLYNIGQAGTKEGEFQYPVDVALSKAGDLYVADLRNQRIQVFSEAGKFMSVLPVKQPIKPTAITLDDSGNVYITDVITNKAMVFSKQGALLQTLGETGSLDGALLFPNGIAVTPDGSEIFVADSQNMRIQVFNKQGQFLRTILAEGKMGLPKGMSIANNQLYVADTLLHKVYVFDLSGKQIGVIGTKAGTFSYPNDVFATDKTIYVADRGHNQITVLPKSVVERSEGK